MKIYFISSWWTNEIHSTEYKRKRSAATISLILLALAGFDEKEFSKFT